MFNQYLKAGTEMNLSVFLSYQNNEEATEKQKFSSYPPPSSS